MPALRAARRGAPTTATFWLLDAPTTSPRRADATPTAPAWGIRPGRSRRGPQQPMAAWEDSEFATEAHELTRTTFIAHVRYATTGGLDGVEHASVPAGRPAVRAQRCGARPRCPRRPPSRSRYRGSRCRAIGFRTRLRVDHRLCSGPWRRCEAGLRDAVEWLADNVPASPSTCCCAPRLISGRCAIPRLTSSTFWTDAGRLNTAGSSCAPTGFAPVPTGLRHSHRWCSQPSEWTTTRPESARAGRAGARRRGFAHRPTSRVSRPAGVSAVHRRPGRESGCGSTGSDSMSSLSRISVPTPDGPIPADLANPEGAGPGRVSPDSAITPR